MAIPRAQSLRGKFPHVALDSGPVVYAAAFSNGMVKVGYTSSARLRMSTVATTARREYGASLVDFHVSAPHASEREARNNEDALLVALWSRGATNLPSRHEYFDGLPFAVAVELCQRITAQPA